MQGIIYHQSHEHSFATYLNMASIIMERKRVRGIWILSAFLLLCPSYVRCQYEGDIRLVDGPTSNEGRVEIYHSGQWGTVCDDSWDDDDASVVCRQLGYSSVGADARTSAYYGQGYGRIHLDEVRCGGYESKLTYCSDDGWGVHDCTHSEDAGVYCNYVSIEGDVRLVDGSTSYEGRVEIYHSGQWGTVCDDEWDDSDARVVCRQLGYTDDFADARSDAYYGQGYGPIHLDNVRCGGYESRLTYCRDNGWGVNDCSHSEDAGVYCGYVTPKPKVSSKVVGMMSFVGVSLSLLTLVTIVAVCYTCNPSKSAVRTSPTEQLPLSTGPGHPAASNTPAAPTTNNITYPLDPTQSSMPAPSQLPTNAYPPATDSDPSSAPPVYESI